MLIAADFFLFNMRGDRYPAAVCFKQDRAVEIRPVDGAFCVMQRTERPFRRMAVIIQRTAGYRRIVRRDRSEKFRRCGMAAAVMTGLEHIRGEIVSGRKHGLLPCFAQIARKQKSFCPAGDAADQRAVIQILKAGILHRVEFQLCRTSWHSGVRTGSCFSAAISRICVNDQTVGVSESGISGR